MRGLWRTTLPIHRKVTKSDQALDLSDCSVHYSPTSKNAKTQFQKVQAAYEILRDRDRRAVYADYLRRRTSRTTAVHIEMSNTDTAQILRFVGLGFSCVLGDERTRQAALRKLNSEREKMTNGKR